MTDRQAETSGPNPAAKALPTVSGMRSLGAIGFLLSALVVLALFFGPASSTNAMLFGIACGLSGLFAFMWMMGAIEQRLIEINLTLGRLERN